MIESRVGYVLLAHERLDRVAQLARFLSAYGSPVAIHIDAKTNNTAYNELVQKFRGNELVYFVSRLRVDWGSFSIVQATLHTSKILLERFSQVNHVMLISGSCLPSRPLEELETFLAEREAMDFIESVSLKTQKWIKGGLDSERFTLYFPFAWRRERKLFDLFVNFQRSLKIDRKPPFEISPHLGSQWWCLTRQTLTRIIRDKNRKRYERFYKLCWIPDESYFQTMARLHSENLQSESLTWSKFNQTGAPFQMYDDHLSAIQRTTHFVVRKVWPGADALYDTLLGKPEFGHARQLDALNNAFNEEYMTGSSSRPLQLNQGRFPVGQADQSDTCQSYTILVGFGALFTNLKNWHNKASDIPFHEGVFGRNKISFANEQDTYKGNLPANAKIRNYDPRSYLRNLIWNNRETHQVFAFDIEDNKKMLDFALKDPNATVIWLKESWVLRFLSLRETGQDTKSKARLLNNLEAKIERLCARKSTRATVETISLQNALDNPSEAAAKLAKACKRPKTGTVNLMPKQAPLAGLELLVRRLRNDGYNLELHAQSGEAQKEAARRSGQL